MENNNVNLNQNNIDTNHLNSPDIPNNKLNSNKKLYVIIAILSAALVVVSTLLVWNMAGNNKEKDDLKESVGEKDKVVEETPVEEEKMTESELAELANELYEKYIAYGTDATMHYEANINDNNKDNYIIMLAINNIIEKNSYKVPVLNMEDDEDGYLISLDKEQVLKIKLSDIQDEIKALFPDIEEIDVSKIKGYNNNPIIHTSKYYIQFRDDNAEVFVVGNASVMSYYQFSKLDSYELVDDKIILETSYFGYGGWAAWINLYNDSFMSKSTYVCADSKEDSEDGMPLCNSKLMLDYSEDGITNRSDVGNYVFENLTNYTTRYKHTFIKNEDGQYYWVSTELVK